MKKPEEMFNIETEIELNAEAQGEGRSKKTFVEPVISEPEDVLKATTFFFQATLGGGTLP
jgi:hypothetical protein